MYYWLQQKTGSSWLAAAITTLAYTGLILMIVLFSELPGETFRYLQL